MKAKLMTLAAAMLALAACGGNPNAQTEQPVPDSASVSMMEPENKQEAAAASEPLPMPTVSDEHRELAANFCYALQASAQCEGLTMRLDTEQKLAERLGMPIRDSGSPLNDDCTKGLMKANEDKNLCRNAWRNFGCNGAVTAKLLQESPFGNNQAQLCQYQ